MAAPVLHRLGPGRPCPRHQQWETFLTRELPPLIDDRLGGNGIRSIAGLSMGAQSAMMLAMRSPGLYRGVAAYSGCYESATPLGQAQMASTVTIERGGIENMWGRFDDQKWASTTVLLGAEKRRGTTLYVSTGNRCAGPHETLDNPTSSRTVCAADRWKPVPTSAPAGSMTACARTGIAATVVYNPVGVHAWTYWRDELAILADTPRPPWTLTDNEGCPCAVCAGAAFRNSGGD
ncbi:hypothetical protein GS461_18040 [Rhodococcus hoagii]|nr:hypothetical protein [Prescottella equi]